MMTCVALLRMCPCSQLTIWGTADFPVWVTTPNFSPRLHFTTKTQFMFLRQEAAAQCESFTSSSDRFIDNNLVFVKFIEGQSAFRDLLNSSLSYHKVIITFSPSVLFIHPLPSQLSTEMQKKDLRQLTGISLHPCKRRGDWNTFKKYR